MYKAPGISNAHKTFMPSFFSYSVHTWYDNKAALFSRVWRKNQQLAGNSTC